MNEKLEQQLDGLLEKYTELLLGDGPETQKDKVKAWILYTYIAKSMPPLVKHWNEQYPDAKQDMMTLIKEIKELNNAHRAKNIGQKK
ncbi:YusU family protein [Sutcliffiella halmapala]|uniref:YusU family protein n=1 Tax=Sutcliffiella halmapala TaxID=79882 RepID=UPI000995C595|nr:YusU family protein [Sutcliffiella halmapala]